MRHLLRALLIILWPLHLLAQPPTLPVPAGVQAEGVPPIPVALADAVARYGEFRSATLLAWHPAERRMLIATAFGNATQIHEVRGPGAARTQLTFFRDGVTGGAAYEPGGRYFVFRKDTAGGGEAMQLFRYDLASGRTIQLTDARSRNGEPVWSHRKGLVAYDSIRTDGRNRDIYVMDPSRPESDRLAAPVQGSWSVLDWSPDDRELLALESAGPSETYLWRIDLESGRRVALNQRTDKPTIWIDARYSRDGGSVYALGDRGGELPRLWRATLATGSWISVTPDGQSIEAFAESPDGLTLAVVVDRNATSHLELLDARTGRVRATPALPAGVVSRLIWRPTGGELAFVFAGARTFSDVYSYSVAQARLHRWTTSEVGGANPESLPDAEIIEWPSFDGRRISGVLYKPSPGFAGRRPVIINLHGGPSLRERPRALGRSNYFRHELGIAIIYPNVRGSTGFGRTFENLDDARQREDAVKDVGALLDWISTQPALDRHRVMVSGASYGGYLTLAAAIAYGDRIRCAFEGFGISDFVTYLESTEESRRQDRRIEYGDPSDPAMRQFLKEISPLTHAAKLKVPLMIAQGAKDTRVPLSQSEALVQAVRSSGTPLWYVVYTDAGHLTMTRATNDFNTYAWVLFVQQFLTGGP